MEWWDKGSRYRLPDNDFGKAERGSRIRHTSTSANAVQNLYLEAYISAKSFCAIRADKVIIERPTSKAEWEQMKKQT